MVYCYNLTKLKGKLLKLKIWMAICQRITSSRGINAKNPIRQTRSSNPTN